MMGKPANPDAALFLQLDHARIYPEQHPLRRIDGVLDLRFVRNAVARLYGTRGNPSVDPQVILRMMLLLFLERVPSERHLCMLMPARLDWCFFCRIDPQLPTPNHSVLSKARRRWGPELFERLFARVLQQCVDAGLVGEECFHCDSSLVKANASLDSRVPRQLWEQLERASTDAPADGPRDDDRGDSAPPPSPQETQPSRGRLNAKLVSTTDPDCATVTRKGRGTLMAYRDHRLVDDRNGIVVATIATPGDTDDAKLLPALIRKCAERAALAPAAVTGDSMYGTVTNFEMLRGATIAPILKKRRGKDTPKRPWTEFLDPCIPPWEAKRLMGRRRTVIEGRWGDAHERHDHRRSRWRRLPRFQMQCNLVATVQNLRKLERALRLRPVGSGVAALERREASGLGRVAAAARSSALPPRSCRRRVSGTGLRRRVGFPHGKSP